MQCVCGPRARVRDQTKRSASCRPLRGKAATSRASVEIRKSRAFLTFPRPACAYRIGSAWCKANDGYSELTRPPPEYRFILQRDGARVRDTNALRIREHVLCTKPGPGRRRHAGRANAEACRRRGSWIISGGSLGWRATGRTGRARRSRLLQLSRCRRKGQRCAFPCHCRSAGCIHDRPNPCVSGTREGKRREARHDEGRRVRTR